MSGPTWPLRPGDESAQSIREQIRPPVTVGSHDLVGDGLSRSDNMIDSEVCALVDQSGSSRNDAIIIHQRQPNVTGELASRTSQVSSIWCDLSYNLDSCPPPTMPMVTETARPRAETRDCFLFFVSSGEHPQSELLVPIAALFPSTRVRASASSASDLLLQTTAR